MSVWEFSGYQPYYVVYDQFVGDVNCVHVVVVDASDSRDVQLSQLLHWLRFITARVRITQPIGKSNSPPTSVLAAFFQGNMGQPLPPRPLPSTYSRREPLG